MITGRNVLAEMKESKAGSVFRDERLDQRGVKLLAAMHREESLVIGQLGATKAERSGYYRFMENPKVKETILAEGLQAACKRHIKEGHVLAISDTTEVNLAKQAGRIKGSLGTISDNKSLGFHLHPSLLLDAEDGEALGISSVQSWVRPLAEAKKEGQKKQQRPIEEKESYKWIKSIKETQGCLADAVKVTYIADREADIYEEFITVKEAKADLLIRSRANRCLYDQEEKLFEHLASQAVLGRYRLQLEADGRKEREAREAQLEVRIAKVKLKRPAHVAKDLAAYVELYALEVREVEFDGKNPILWRLLTTHEASTISQAQHIIQWYAWRWHIEQLFRTLKKQGLDIEAVELGDMDAIRKLAVLALDLALKVMQLARARDGSKLRVQRLFSIPEQACLQMLLTRFEGKTKKQRNPHPADSLAWASWIIARLGGWNGYLSQRPPAVITFYRGLAKFDSIFLGWSLALDA